MIGSPAKLPTSHTTPHIAKEPIPEHGVNGKMQGKYTDNNGIPRFINLAEGRVKGPNGVPIKPPKQK